MPCFYTGYWTIDSGPGIEDRIQWSLPREHQHYVETSAPEDLFINPEQLDLNPEVIQKGMEYWTKAASPPVGSWYVPSYQLNGGANWTMATFYIKGSWYVSGGFKDVVNPWTSGPMMVEASWYVRQDHINVSGIWTVNTFYPKGSWYPKTSPIPGSLLDAWYVRPLILSGSWQVKGAC